MTSHWSFSASAGTAAIACAGWCLCLYLSVLQWHRRGGGFRLGAVEGTRFLAVSLVCAALFKPELVRDVPHTEAPQVAILRDASGSMATRDVPTPDGPVQTRAQWLATQAAPARWQPLAARGRVSVDDFSAPPATNSPVEEGTDLNGALDRALARTENLKAVLLLSDGDWNLGQSPLVAATRFSARDIPIYAVGVGSETALPDLSLEHSNVPAYGLLGDQITIPFHIRSRLSREVHTAVVLSSPSGLVLRKAVTIPAFGEVTDSLVWNPTQPGDYDLTLRLPVEADEAIPDNNEQHFRVSIRTEKLKVLIVDSLPRWEYRYLRNALSRDPGVELQTLLLNPGMEPGAGLDYLPVFPGGKEQLSRFDVVFLGDVGLGQNELTSENFAALRGLVEQQGSGLVLLPGARGRELTLPATALKDLLPVDFDPAKPEGLGTENEAHLLLTGEGQGHLLTLLAPDAATNASIWRNLPGFYWCAAVSARPGAEVLAVHSTLRNEQGRVPLLVTRPFGNGKVLFMGTDGAWRWRRGVEDKYHYRFWGQVIRWMAHQRHLAEGERIRLSFSPETPRAGDAVTLLATVFDAGGFPVEKGSVSARVLDPGTGATERLDLTPVPGGWGVFKGEYTPRTSGRHHLTIRDEISGQHLESDLNVERSSRERVGDPANFAILRELATLTHGLFGGTGELDHILNQIALLPEPHPVEQRIPLWSEWYTAATLLTLLGIYWTARKLSGLT